MSQFDAQGLEIGGAMPFLHQSFPPKILNIMYNGCDFQDNKNTTEQACQNRKGRAKARTRRRARNSRPRNRQHSSGRRSN
jgi:hypothetical protein